MQLKINRKIYTSVSIILHLFYNLCPIPWCNWQMLSHEGHTVDSFYKRMSLARQKMCLKGIFRKIFWTFLHLSVVFHMEDAIPIQDDMWHRESTSQSFHLSWQLCTRHHDRFYYSRHVLPSKKKKEKNVFSSQGLLYAKSHQVAK